MYNGYLPRGLTEDDLSPDEGEQGDDVEKRRAGESCEISAEIFSSAGENTSSEVVEQPTHTASGADSNFPTCSMPGLSQEMWQVCRHVMQQAKLGFPSLDHKQL